MRRRPTVLRSPWTGLLAAAALLAPAAAHAAGDGLEIIPDPTKLLVLLVFFVLLVPILDQLVFRPLLDLLDEREQRIAGARTRAGELAQQAAQLVAQHDDAIRRARESAHAEQASQVEEARRQHQGAISEARQEADREITGARAQIEQAAAATRGALGAEAAPLAREIAARLLGRSAA